jgi:hypothetical protein
MHFRFTEIRNSQSRQGIRPNCRLNSRSNFGSPGMFSDIQQDSTFRIALHAGFFTDAASTGKLMPSENGRILGTLRWPMKAADFRRIALSLGHVEEYDHAGSPAFRVGGRKFASLGIASGGIRKSDANARAAGGVCRGGARDFPADSWRLGKDGPHAYTASGGERPAV